MGGFSKGFSKLFSSIIIRWIFRGFRFKVMEINVNGIV